MAHFYGTIQGSRGQATRCGTKSSDLETVAASWEGSVHVRLVHNEVTGVDMATVWLAPWHGRGVERTLYHGPVSGAPFPVTKAVA
jgi:hypothetical protein